MATTPLIKAISEIKGRFAIIDGEQIMCMLLDDGRVHPSYDVGVWLSAPFFASAMESMLEFAWKVFKPVSKVKVK